MSIAFKLDSGQINRVIDALKKVTGKSEEAVFKKAVNNTAQYAKKELASQAKAVYIGQMANSISSRAKIKKATVGKLGAEIDFGNQSRVPSILKFKASPKATPTKFLKSGRHLQKIGSSYRYVGRQKQYNVKAGQLKGSAKTIKGAFITTMKSGRTGMFYRRPDGKLEQVLGSTDRAMIRNEKVYPKVEPKISKKLNEQVEAALSKALGGK